MKNFIKSALILTILTTLVACGPKEDKQASDPSSEIASKVALETSESATAGHTEDESPTTSNKDTASMETTGKGADYSVFTDISAEEVQRFAEAVKTDVIASDWADLSEKISYPITIGTNTFDSADEFTAFDLDSLLTEDYKAAIAGTDTTALFANYQGAMLGERGEMWIAEVLDDSLTSLGLKVIAINIAE
ncbi:hypothetical protein [Lacrimispora sp.]|uniref:hypothetical protein n=1 Tax=Lacrimispora sp. TaxID=2719234 RepID=UPI002898C4DF|nr:hypothetical protein [Lacrimispora sp.]